MSSWSPPTRRVVDVVEFLVQRGEQRCRLSDVARELDLNQATAYAILQELCAGGWTTRDPSSKTFTIGPAFVAMARQLDQSDRRVYRSFTGRKPTRTVVVAWNPYRFQSRLLKAFRQCLRR